MTIAQARQEFGSRYDLWALHVAEREAEQLFPHFGVFKGGITWKLNRFVRQLTKSERLVFVRINRKDVYFRESNGRSEPLSNDEKQFLDRYYGFCLGQRGLQTEIPAKRRAGEKIKFASKKTLHKAIAEKFVGAFGDRGIEVEPNLYDGVGFEMSCAGWRIITTFTSGPRAGEMDYRHLIAGETGRVNPDGTVTFPAPILAMFAWTNICPIRWEYLFDADVEPACNSAVELCREVFDALPKLLSGIERDKVIDE
jgi:hypothetical protein